MTKTVQDYIENPSKECKEYVLKRQHKEGSVGDEGARQRLTKDWFERKKKYDTARRTKVKQKIMKASQGA